MILLLCICPRALTAKRGKRPTRQYGAAPQVCLAWKRGCGGWKDEHFSTCLVANRPWSDPQGPCRFLVNLEAVPRQLVNLTSRRDEEIPNCNGPMFWSLSFEDGRWPAGRPPLLPSKLWGTEKDREGKRAAFRSVLQNTYCAVRAGPESLVSPHIDGKGCCIPPLLTGT